MAGWIALILAVTLGVALLYRSGDSTIAGLEPAEYVGIALAIGLCSVYLLSIFGSYRGRGRQALRDILAWACLAIALVIGYSYRDEFTQVYYRLAGELAPPGTALTAETGTNGERAVRIRRRSDGHFAASTSVNGARIAMLIDTGASTVVLKQADAKAAGIDMRGLSYTIPVSTANGQTFAARVRLRSVVIGSIQIDNIEALVAKPGALRESLLGMTFLSRLRSYEFSGEFLTLRG
jgi:aspartyl protease family protein